MVQSIQQYYLRRMIRFGWTEVIIVTFGDVLIPEISSVDGGEAWDSAFVRML